jgi:uncharacterized membrane-anchored protein YjiN (DUF445 family)
LVSRACFKNIITDVSKIEHNINFSIVLYFVTSFSRGRVMRNKKFADIILITLTISFIMVTLFRIFIFNGFIVELISFTTEAALVGAIADWFAVTALFRKPLGFSWHTAIIPRNKQKVIEAIVNVVESELLSSEVIRNKLEQVDIVDRFVNYIENVKTKIKFTNLLAKYGEGFLEKLDTPKIANYIEELLKRNLEQMKLSLHISNLLDISINNGMHEELLVTLTEELIKVAKKDSTRDVIYNILDSEKKKSMKTTTGFKRVFFELSLGIAEGTNSINISEASEAMQKELVEILISIKNKDNELYFKLKKALEEAGERIKTDETLSNSIEVWKQDIIEHLDLQEDLEKLISQTKDNAENNVMVINWISAELDKYWMSFKEDHKRREWINGIIKDTLYKIIESEHYLVGKIVKDTLSAFTDEALNTFIESKAGNDLHWIRINGAIVGAISGVIVFLFLNLFYDPLIQKLFLGI